MNQTISITAERVSMSSLRKISLTAGVFYLLTFVSIPTLSLYGPVKTPGFILGQGPDTPVIVGAILEMIVALAGIGTAVALYPVLMKQDKARALGFAGSRVLEAATIYSGIVSLLSIVTLRQSGIGSAGLATEHALAAQYYWAFLFGQSFIPAVNGVLLGSLLYQSRLVPRALPVLGLFGSTLLVVAWVGILSGFFAQVSGTTALLTIPIALWEFSLGIYLVVKGFRPSPLTVGL